jgi:hypothetical protein
MSNFIQDVLNERRAMDVALVDMLVDYQHNPTRTLARTIELIQEEIELKNRRVSHARLLTDSMG